MVNFGPLTAEIGSGVWGTPANFNGFRLLRSLLHRRRSPEANQTLKDVWQSPAPTFGGSCPLTEFCLVQNSLYAQVLSSPILAELLHSTPAEGISQTLWNGSRNERVPPTFGCTAITLGISAQSSCFLLHLF